MRKDTLVDSGDVTADPVDTFTFDIECTRGGNVVHSGSHTLTTSTATATGATGGITYDELPLLAPGTTCVIGEQDPGSDWTQVGGDVTVEIAADSTPTAVFTNEREVREFTVTKEIEGLPDGVDMDATGFVVDLTCTGDFDGTNSLTLTDQVVSVDVPLVLAGFPLGANCVVIEDAEVQFLSLIHI